jgi:hypothetical protein
VPASCSNGGSVNVAGDGCKTPVFTDADNNAGTDASCADGELNTDGDACKAVVFTDIGCKTAVFTAKDYACKAGDFGSSDTACCADAATTTATPETKNEINPGTEDSAATTTLGVASAVAAAAAFARLL